VLFLKAKEQGPGPASAGDQSSNLGETVIAGAVVLVSALGDMNDIGSGLPLADEPGSGFDRQRFARQPGTRACLESVAMALAICCNRVGTLRRVLRSLFLKTVGQNADHQIPSQPWLWRGLKELFPKFAKAALLRLGIFASRSTILPGIDSSPKAQQHFRSDSENSQVHRERKQA